MFLQKFLHIILLIPFCPPLKYTWIGTCAQYNGISWAGKERTACCAKECGSCGGVGCGSRPGGPMSCCVSQIPESQICKTGDQYAPCTLRGMYRSHFKFKKFVEIPRIYYYYYYYYYYHYYYYSTNRDR